MNNTQQLIDHHEEECNLVKRKFKWWKIDGPWMDEPHRVQWKHKGLDCLIVRNPSMFTLCGYVAVKPGHPFYKQHYDKVDLPAHGGLTYSGSCSGHICHISDDKKDDVWWLGFDYAHLGDAMPYIEIVRKQNPEFKKLRDGLLDPEHYHTIKEVIKDVESIAELTAEHK